MRWITRATAVAAVTAGGVAAGRAISTRAFGRWPTGPWRKEQPRWVVVTVHRSPAEIAPDGVLPEPLERLGDTVEVQIRPAPGDRGTELAARPADGDPGEDPAGTWRGIRLALRHSKQLLETGEILNPDRPPTTRRTLTNRPLEYATRYAREEGRV